MGIVWHYLTSRGPSLEAADVAGRDVVVWVVVVVVRASSEVEARMLYGGGTREKFGGREEASFAPEATTGLSSPWPTNNFSLPVPST